MSIDRYEPLRVIGSGGMATVWCARDAVLDRLVAIKRPNDAPKGSSAAARFAREARAAATVAHPNLVAVYDAGVDETGPYLVMELIDGPSLATANVAPDQIARIGIQTASALAALHAAGVVHGDVKPGNILLAPSGAKLSDFGIARAPDDTVTQPGITFATPAYAAPETVSHGERSAAADVYSLAATLHELLTGSRWNTAVGSTQVMPPGEWARVLAPALAIRPTERPTAAAFAASLATLESHGANAAPTVPMTVPPPPTGASIATPRRSRYWGTGVVVVFAVGALLIALIVALASRDDPVTGADGTESTVPGTAAATTIAPSTSAPPPTTAAPTTAAPTTAPPQTPPPTSPAGPAAVAAELVALINDVPPDQLKPKEGDDIVKRIDDVLRVASERPGETQKKLREAAEQIGKDLEDSDTRTRAEQLLIDLANSLGLPDSTVIEAFEPDDSEDD